MKTVSMYFSPTGGTLKVMEILGKTFIPEVKIDLCENSGNDNSYRLEQDDLCLIGVPSFGGRVPAIAAERIQEIQGNGAKAVVVVVYGNRAYDDTLLELKEVAENSGYNVVAAIAAAAEHSIMHQFAAGRPDLQDEEELHQFARQISKLVKENNGSGKLQVPGNKPYREYNGVPFKPKANKSCDRCGLCVKNCPVSAIAAENPSSTDEKKCISCMRCISICPQNARKLNALVLAAASQKMKKACEGRKENELYLLHTSDGKGNSQE